MQRILPAERTAMLFFVLHLLVAGLSAELYRRFWFLGVIPSIVLWVTTLLFFVTSSNRVLCSGDLEGARLARSLAAMPLMLTAVVAVSWWAALPQRAAASLYLVAHRPELAVAKVQAGPNRAAAIPYVEGIPDGGAAIIYSPQVRPEQLSQQEQLRLTGERIGACRRLAAAETWLCGYD